MQPQPQASSLRPPRSPQISGRGPGHAVPAPPLAAGAAAQQASPHSLRRTSSLPADSDTAQPLALPPPSVVRLPPKPQRRASLPAGPDMLAPAPAPAPAARGQALRRASSLPSGPDDARPPPAAPPPPLRPTRTLSGHGPGHALRRAASLPPAPRQSLQRTASAASTARQGPLARFEIVTDKTDYCEGDLIRGSVLVQAAPAQASANADWPHASDIALLIEGSEKVTWSEFEIPSVDWSEEELAAGGDRHASSHVLLRAAVPLAKREEGPDPPEPGGALLFPFAFGLPDGLTATFRARETGLNGAAFFKIEVAYRLEARLAGVRTAVEFAVHRRPAGVDPERAYAHFTASAQSFCRCLVPFKERHMEARTDKAAYAPGDTITLSLRAEKSKRGGGGEQDDLTQMRAARPRLQRLVHVAGPGPLPGELHFSCSRLGTAYEDLGAFTAEGATQISGKAYAVYRLQLPRTMPPSVQGRTFSYGYAIEITVLSELDDDQRGDMRIEILDRRGSNALSPRGPYPSKDMIYAEKSMVRPPAVALKK